MLARAVTLQLEKPHHEGDGLFVCHVPQGMRNLGVASLRYSAQTYAYWLLVTGRYPHASPVLRDPGPGPEPRPRFAPPEPVLGDTF